MAETVTLGFVGTGGMARHHLGQLAGLEGVRKLFLESAPGVDVLRVIDLQRKLLQGREGLLDALWEVNQAQADLVAAVGDPLLAAGPCPPLSPCVFQEIGTSLLLQSAAVSTTRTAPMLLFAHAWIMVGRSSVIATTSPALAAAMRPPTTARRTNDLSRQRAIVSTLASFTRR